LIAKGCHHLRPNGRLIRYKYANGSIILAQCVTNCASFRLSEARAAILFNGEAIDSQSFDSWYDKLWQLCLVDVWGKSIIVLFHKCFSGLSLDDGIRAHELIKVKTFPDVKSWTLFGCS
jgi:hypothetical protein